MERNMRERVADRLAFVRDVGLIMLPFVAFLFGLLLLLSGCTSIEDRAAQRCASLGVPGDVQCQLQVESMLRLQRAAIGSAIILGTSVQNQNVRVTH